ncbi:MAG: hypothetical protein JRI46_09340 [Deltaproteobacteria bacterium]|nr:hypothetical protein [Deltaproteobacteria bacterium]
MPLLKLLVFTTFPLPILILSRGFRTDRLIFSFYLLCVCSAAYLWSLGTPEAVQQALTFSFLALLLLNLFFSLAVRAVRSSIYRISTVISISFTLFLIAVFMIDYRPQLLATDLFFPHPVLPHLTMISVVFSIALLIFSCEIWERNVGGGLVERAFWAGTALWWTMFLYLIIKMVMTQGRAPFSLFTYLSFFHLLGLATIYYLLFKTDFLAVRVHPSPYLLTKITMTIFVLAVLGIFIWLEILIKGWVDIPPYLLDLFLIASFFIGAFFFVVPVRPQRWFKERIYHHLYLPEQDFALEVKFYLDVIGYKRKKERILSHLHERLGIEGVALYGIENTHLRLLSTFPLNVSLPKELESSPKKGWEIEGVVCQKVIPLQNNGDIRGYLLLLHKGRKTFSGEEESLIRFWSNTLGILLQEMEEAERRQQQEKMMVFSQATSFILHDAKNMAQLLDLLVKNSALLQGKQEAREFLKELLPALQKARERARRILDKIAAFNPIEGVELMEADLQVVIKGVADNFTKANNDAEVRLKLIPAMTKTNTEIISRVVENLLLNAWQASHDGGSIEIELSEDHGSYLIAIKDRGRGVPEEEQAQLFKPFFTTKPGGTGLGLYQSQVLLEKIGGKIWYAPNGEKGSIFYVQLQG